jgi:hypothetical protein
VPYQRATDEVWIRLAAATVEVFYNSKRCASHVRSFEYGGTTTNPAHMPASHRKYAAESDASFEDWATQVGPHTLALVLQFSPTVRTPSIPLHRDIPRTAWSRPARRRCARARGRTSRRRSASART